PNTVTSWALPPHSRTSLAPSGSRCVAGLKVRGWGSSGLSPHRFTDTDFMALLIKISVCRGSFRPPLWATKAKSRTNSNLMGDGKIFGQHSRHKTRSSGLFSWFRLSGSVIYLARSAGLVIILPHKGTSHGRYVSE